jgi:hypothetical protein
MAQALRREWERRKRWGIRRRTAEEDEGGKGGVEGRVSGEDGEDGEDGLGYRSFFNIAVRQRFIIYSV